MANDQVCSDHRKGNLFLLVSPTLAYQRGVRFVVLVYAVPPPSPSCLLRLVVNKHPEAHPENPNTPITINISKPCFDRGMLSGQRANGARVEKGYRARSFSEILGRKDGAGLPASPIANTKRANTNSVTLTDTTNETLPTVLIASRAPAKLVVHSPATMPAVNSPQKAWITAPNDHTPMAHKYPFFVSIQSTNFPANNIDTA